MFDMSNVADKLSSDSKNIKLDTTINPIEIQMDIMKKMGNAAKPKSTFKGSYTQNCMPPSPFSTYSNQQYQYPAVQIPPQIYQGQYTYNYSNWQQPNVQNAYAMQQDAYNQQMAQMQQMQAQPQTYNQQMQSQPQAMPATAATGY